MKLLIILCDRCSLIVKRGNRLGTVLAALLLFVSSSVLVADDDVISEMVVFGASYSDTGNVFLATGFAIPLSPPYFPVDLAMAVCGMKLSRASSDYRRHNPI